MATPAAGVKGTYAPVSQADSVASDVDRLRKEYEEKLTEKDRLLEKLQRDLEEAKSEVSRKSAS